jgi:hypothetical protein
VHAGYTSYAVEERLYQLKQFVERLLLFHTFNKPGFETLRNAAEFLDLPQDTQELKKKISFYERALKYRSG